MPYSEPTPEQLRAYRRSYERRQLGFIAINVAWGLVVLVGVGQCDAWLARRGGLPLWGVAGGIAAIVAALIGGTLVWQCPRCEVPFGRRFSVDECPDCHLRLE